MDSETTHAETAIVCSSAQCMGTRRGARRCRRFGPISLDDGMFFCHDHEGERPNWAWLAAPHDGSSTS